MRYIATAFLVGTSILFATEYTITKKAHFNPLLVSGYEQCENSAINMIKKEAINDYIGCESNNQYDISITQLRYGKRTITLDECIIEATLEINSKLLSKNNYLLGESGVICSGYNTQLIENDSSWNSLELGIYYALSSSQKSLEMISNNHKIFYDYEDVPMYGINLSYLYKIVNSQYIGIKLNYAKSFETYSQTSSLDTKSRNDGDPSISQTGATLIYGYRYHIKVEGTVGLNYTKESVIRTYTNNSYKAEITSINAEIGIGYYIVPYLKIWGDINSVLSTKVGISWSY